MYFLNNSFSVISADPLAENASHNSHINLIDMYNDFESSTIACPNASERFRVNSKLLNLYN